MDTCIDLYDCANTKIIKIIIENRTEGTDSYR